MEPTPSHLTWTAPEFNTPTANTPTLLLLLGIFLAIIIYALVENSSIMAITFVLLGTVTLLHSRKPPKTLNCSITSKGITLEKEFYDFDNIASFWIVFESDEQSIFLKTSGSLIASVRVPLGDMNPNTVRETLLKHIRETKYEPTLIDTLSRFLHI